MTCELKRSDPRVYRIKIKGFVDNDFVDSFCPPGCALERESDATILSNIHTDQSGILGLIRQLHNLGCTIVSMNCEDPSSLALC